MYAIVESGGKQYRVVPQQTIEVEKLAANPGEIIKLDRVLLIQTEKALEIGAPYLVNKTIQAEVLKQDRHKKVKIIHFKRRKHHLKRQGHRQAFTQLKILSIGDSQDGS